MTASGHSRPERPQHKVRPRPLTPETDQRLFQGHMSRRVNKRQSATVTSRVRKHIAIDPQRFDRLVRWPLGLMPDLLPQSSEA